MDGSLTAIMCAMFQLVMLVGIGVVVAPVVLAMYQGLVNKIWLLQRDLGRLQKRLDETAEATPAAAPELASTALAPLVESSATQVEASADLVATVELLEPDTETSELELDPATDVDGDLPEPPTAVPVEQPPSRPAPIALPSMERVVVWVAAGLGSLALLFGVLFGLVAVAQLGWFGPATRCAAAMVGGTALWGVGAALRSRQPVVSSALSGVGMGVLFGALFAANSFYGLIGNNTTFLLLVGLVVVATLRSAVTNDRFMTHVGLLGGFLAPVMVSTGNNAAVALFSYLFLLVSGVLVAAAWRGWFDVVLTAAAGTALMYLGWTASWYEPSSALVAQVAAGMLSLPFAAIVASKRHDGTWIGMAMSVTGALGAATMCLVALPWLIPIDPTFTDPRSGLIVVNSVGPWAPLFATLAVALFPAPLWLGGRLRRSRLVSLTAVLVSLPLLVTWTAWSFRFSATTMPLILGALGPLIVAVVLHLGDRKTGLAVSILPLGAGLTLALMMANKPPGEVFSAAVIGLALLSVIAAWASSSGVSILAGVCGVGMVVWLTPLLDIGPAWSAGATLTALGVLSYPTLMSRWSSDRFPALPWFGAVSANLVAFPVLYFCWKEAWGLSVIGVLPLLIALNAILSAWVLHKTHGLSRRDPVLAVVVAIAIAGITFALPIQVQETWLTVGWAMEAAALAVLSRRLTHPLLRWTSVLLGLAIGVRLLINPYALAYGDASGWPILNWTLWTWGIPTVCLLVAAKFVERPAVVVKAGDWRSVDWLVWAPVALRVLAMFTGFALVNMEVSHAFQDAGPVELGGSTMLQGMVRSISWGGWGLFLLVVGLFVNRRYTRFIGFSFILLATAKVFVYDIWSLPGFVRVGSLMGLGVTLLIAAFLFERLVLRDGPVTTSDASKGA
jgi:uncharacterized membrane protein